MQRTNVDPNELINFPTGSGITGEVYRRQSTMFFNNFINPLANIYYSADVDNITAIENVANLAVTPMVRSDGTSNGAIHLYNRAGRIEPSTCRKLDGLRGFLGGMVENLEARKLLVTQQIAIRSDERTYEPHLEAAQTLHDDNIVWWMNQTKPFDKMATELQKNERDNSALERELQESWEQVETIEKSRMDAMKAKNAWAKAGGKKTK